jgi:hypothetical protein
MAIENPPVIVVFPFKYPDASRCPFDMFYSLHYIAVFGWTGVYFLVECPSHPQPL